MFLSLTSLCFAQGDRGTIRGTVTDQSGAAVPEAAVTARNVRTGLVQSGVTSVEGVYTFLYLPVGTYRVTVEKPGFRRAEATDLVVNVSSLVTQDMQLTVGDVGQSIEVTAGAALLEQQGTNLGKVVSTKAIMDLPLFISGGLRSNMTFISLTPGVTGSSNNPRIGGGLQTGQSVQLDGAESQSERSNDAGMNGVSVEAVEEFKVQSGAYSAEFGRTSNGIINWVTKSGTNEVHGSGFLFNRNEFFNARGYTFTPTTRPVVRQWNYGGSVGGPIYIPKLYNGRNKAFFFFAYERADTRNGRSTSLVTVPIEEFRNGDFRRYVDSANRVIPLYDPFDANGNLIQDAFARPRLECRGVLNVICPERIDPTAKSVQSVLPPPDDPTKITNNTRSGSRSSSKLQVPSIKGDYLFSEKQRVSFLYGRWTNPAQPGFGPVEGVPNLNWPTDQKIQYYRFNHDYIIKPNLMNHLTLGLNRRHLVENPDNINNVPDDWRVAVQIPGTPNGGKPGKSTRYNTEWVTYSTHVDTDSRQRSWNLKEQVAWLKGRHSVKFGFDYIKVFYRRLDCNDCAGQILFSRAATGNPGASGTTGSAEASFMLGLASFGQTAYGGDFGYFFPYYAWYTQDDFKVTSRLTVNIGLRYDLPISKEEMNHKNSNLNPNLPNPAAGGLPGALEFAGDGPGRTGRSRFGETRKNAWGPRFGIAYQLTPKTVVRAGGSIFYQPVRENGNADRGTEGFGGWFYSQTDYLGTGISFRLREGFNTYASQIRAGTPPRVDPTLALYSTPYYYFPQAGRAPYFTDWNFTVEHSFITNSVARVSYHANIGNKLLKTITMNQLDPKYWSIYGTLLGRRLDDPLVIATGFKPPYPGYPTSRQLQQALRPFPQYDNINTSAGGMNDGHMTYHALEASYEHRFNHGLYMLASYTFCKLISNTDDEGGTGTYNQNDYDRRAEKSVSAQDTPHNFRVAYVYELPFGRGKKYLGQTNRLVNALVGNWRVSGIHTYVSGQPLGPFTSSQQVYGASGVNPSVGGATTTVAYATRASFASPAQPLLNPAWNSSPETAWSVPYLNPAAFRRPANMEFGNMPRLLDYLRGPGAVNEDLSILKNFHFDERRYLEFRASAANALNRHRLPGPNTNVDSPDFGKITQPQGNSPRTIQLGAKFYF